MDQRLLANDYDTIASKIKTLSQDIQYIQRQSDLIGGIDDTATFRKQLTLKIQSTSKTVMSIKNQLQRANDNGGTDGKWKKLEGQFFQNFERLRDVTTSVGSKFKESEAREPKSRQKDKLLDNRNNGYGTSSNGQYQNDINKPQNNNNNMEQQQSQ